jgi:hypothetical protein
MELPKYSENRKLADLGVAIVKNIIENKLNWIFRKLSLDDDFGLDGYIDILQDGKYVTGKSIGVQIKTGASYFKNETQSGWYFHGENKHLNYYLNNRIPIIVIIVNPETQKAYWNEITTDNILKTDKSWKLNINKTKVLNDKLALLEIAGDFIDYGPQLENLSKINKEMIKSGLIFVAISRDEIEAGNCEGIQMLLKWLTASDEMIKKCRNKLMITIFGYDNDPRELFQIDEVRKWMQTALGIFKYWGYFLTMDKSLRHLSSLKILLFCNIPVTFLGRIESNKKVNIEYSPIDAKDFKNKIFEWLNEFSYTYNISEKFTFDQSMLILQTIDGITDKEVGTLRKKYGF